ASDLAGGTVALDPNTEYRVLTLTNISVVDRPYDGTTRVELTGAQLDNAVASDLAGGTVALDSSTEYGVMSDKNARANKLLTAQYELTGADQDNYILTLPT
ncbi:YDG domain-containing protein, partial [Hyphomonas beringensis]|uniref:YDG domain-containing protein n=1 Tax=Hyphomonas beringensis TaxID=1280946 RepID=UPI00055310F8